ncbi:superinfection exclusion protein A [Serratia sp. JSRIV004]|uniref:superinfection exclusion protein A n=1 Tax=Serratia sp. JSRIV004 TaxID=2831895 RepID=UPI001CC19264|nr:superinfection exclusion protein A [Serratia sp. JSRIV004]UAN59652.1 superinfection exclusion protein A [Serratia sp. JSRIV004]
MSDSMYFALLVAATMVIGIAMQIAWIFFSNYLERRRLDARFSEISIAIGKNSQRPENSGLVIDYLKNKFSPSKFENRITDAIGFAFKVTIYFLSAAITILYLSMIFGRIFDFWNVEPVLLWMPMILQLTINIFLLVLSVIVKILFGRYPTEASSFNKSYAKTLE